MGRARVFLADDHTLVLEGIGKLLEPRFDLVGTAEDGRAAVQGVEKLQPDVVLLDVSMPGLSGIEAARQIREKAPRTKMLALSMHSDPLYVAEALRAGCSGYLLKRSAAPELIFAIDEVLEGREYVTPGIARGEIREVLDKPRLTPRQREVLKLVAEGKSIKEIAAILLISVKTVEFHKARIMGALGLHTTADLTKYAVARGIVSLEA